MTSAKDRRVFTLYGESDLDLLDDLSRYVGGALHHVLSAYVVTVKRVDGQWELTLEVIDE